jgi:hypothetical protein
MIHKDNIGVHPGNADALSTDTPMHTINHVFVHPSYTGTINMRSIYEYNLAVVLVRKTPYIL